MSRCTDCGRASSVMVHHRVLVPMRFYMRVVEWNECADCFAKAEVRNEELKRYSEGAR